MLCSVCVDVCVCVFLCVCRQRLRDIPALLFPHPSSSHTHTHTHTHTHKHSIATYFNRYAFTYVAMYGTPFVESGREAFQLFKSRGLSAIINDQLIANVMMFASFGSGVLVGLIGYGYALAFGLDGGYKALLGGLGFVMGLLVCSIVLSIMDSAVATVFVCWAEANDALLRSAPDLHAEMTKAWGEAQEPVQM